MRSGNVPLFSQLRTVLLALFLLCFATLYPSVALSQPSVAVLDFSVGTTDRVELEVRGEGGSRSATLERSRQSNLLTNRLVDALVNSGEVSVVERSDIDRILDEGRFTESNLVDPENATEMGRLLGADYMILGAITMVDPRVQVEELPYDAGQQVIAKMDVAANARLVNTETGQIEASVDTEASNQSGGRGSDPRSSNNEGLTGSFQQETYRMLAHKLAGSLLDTLSPLQVAQQEGDTVYLARANMERGQKCRVFSSGETITHPETGEVLGSAEQPVALVEVVRGMEGMSQAKVVEWESESESIENGSHCRLLN